MMILMKSVITHWFKKKLLSRYSTQITIKQLDCKEMTAFDGIKIEFMYIRTLLFCLKGIKGQLSNAALKEK